MPSHNIEKIRSAHLEGLNQRLKELYTITEVLEVNGEKRNVERNILEEIEKFEWLEKVYSVIETQGIPIGKTYTDYSTYLKNLRQKLKEYRAKKEEIEKNNDAEIKNIKLLIEAFSQTN